MVTVAPPRPRWILAAALSVSWSLVLVACRSTPAAPPATLQRCERVSAVRNAASAPLLPAGPCELPTFDFAKFRILLAQLRGTPVVVNIWSSLCGPCIYEAPELAKLARQYEGRVQFLGVDIQDTRPLAWGFIAKYGYNYPSVFDPHAVIRRGLGFLSRPDTILYDRSGKQVWVWGGPLDAKGLSKQLDRIVSS